MIKPPATIRARLALWHVMVMAVILAAFAIGTYGVVRESLFAQIDARLAENLALLVTTARTDTTELIEVERHTRVPAFRVMEGDWPIYVSGGWIAADLDSSQAPKNGRWIYAPARGGIYHIKEETLVLGKRQLRIATAEQSEQIHRGLERFAITLSTGFPVALLLSLLGGYFLAGRILTPLQHITQRARTISADNLSQRLEIANPLDELGQLSTILNDAFARLYQTFNQLKRFTQDAAHELRTPLTVLRSVGEVGLQKPRDVTAYQEIIGSMLEEVNRLEHLVDGLLTLARTEAGQYSIPKQAEDLTILCQEVVECLRVLAEEKHQSLTFNATQKFIAHIDRETMRIALMNLLANAIRFTPHDGTISIALYGWDGSTAIDIEDNGPGIPAHHHSQIFERFYRVDPSRSHQSGGAGLGLAIARWAVEANAGRIELQSLSGQGCLFRIVLPGTN